MIEVQRVVRADGERVLDVLADGWTYVAWVVGSARIRGVDPAWPEPGSRIAHSAGLWPVVIDDETVARAWDRGAGVLELLARGWPAGEAHVTLRVEPHPAGCTVSIVEDAVRGPGTLVPHGVRQRVIGSRNRETLRRLATLAERPPARRAVPGD